MTEPPTESDLQQIASSLPPNKWKSLGRVLGLSNSDLANIVANHPHDPVEQRYQMLQLWCSQNEDASWDKLADALCSDEVGCSYLARKFQVRECKSGVCEDAHLCCFCVRIWVMSAAGIEVVYVGAEPLLVIAFPW